MSARHELVSGKGTFWRCLCGAVGEGIDALHAHQAEARREAKAEAWRKRP